MRHLIRGNLWKVGKDVSTTGSLASCVIWITGLSGAGKSTLALQVQQQLRAGQVSCILLDGDSVREVMGNDLGHTLADRLENAYRIARLARYLARQELVVICATMSLFPEVWNWNRAQIERYFEVYLKVSKETLVKRDPKGLYRRASDGTESHIIGWDVPFQEPLSPDLIVDNNIQADAQLLSSKAAAIIEAARATLG